MRNSWTSVIVTQVLLASLTVLAAIAVGETGMRLFHYVRDGRAFVGSPSGDRVSHTSVFEADSVLGWKTSAHHKRAYEVTDLNGTKRNVNYSTGPHGFRLFGDPLSIYGKLLIVGDSFTHAAEVSDDQTYYAKLKSAMSDYLPQVFVYGAAGYGTLQEILIIERYYETVRPTAILIQICSNDFVNNSYELESASNENNNRMLRPYLGADRRTTMEIPQSTLRRAMLWLGAYSRLITWVVFRIDNWIAVNRLVPTVEDAIRRQSTAHPGFMRAIAITDRLFERLRSAVPADVKIYAFQVDEKEPFASEFRKLFARHGIIDIEGVAQAISNAADRGEVVYASDGAHWAPGGHSIAATIIEKQLRAELSESSLSQRK